MSSQTDLLICGLGNPGPKYEHTRHNIGWMLIDSFAEKINANFLPASPIYWLAEKKYAGKNLLLAKPTTFMNNSGEAVRKIAAKYALNPNNIIIITDEYNFPVGKVHLKKGGSDGGHNGMASIIEYLEDLNFWRFRCGIGKAFPPGGLVDYVLSDFSDGQLEGKNRMLKNSIAALIHIVKAGLQRAMSDINSGKLFEEVEIKKPQQAKSNEMNNTEK